MTVPQPRPPALTIEPLTDANEAAWEAFVQSAPEATFFHRAGWRRVIRNAYRYDCHHCLVRQDGRVTGVLPLVHVKSRLFGNALISMAFCVYGGIVAETPEAAAALGAEAAALGEKLRVDYVELRGIAPQLPAWKSKADLYATFHRTLADDDDANLKAIPRKKRADVRKSLKNNLVLETDVAVDAFYRIYAESVRDLGTPVFARRYVTALVDEFGGDVDMCVVRGPEGPVASLLSFFFRDQVLPYYGGALPAARALHAYDFLYWMMMCRAVQRGVRTFDFGRSKVGTGPYSYKTFWGFEPTPLHYQYHLVRAEAVPDINPLNPKYSLMVRTWQRLPLAVANRVGPWVARQLG
jgi:FemAB-related protein (PEP-CTERM system-associated)